jgi:hypothetical protein
MLVFPASVNRFGRLYGHFWCQHRHSSTSTLAWTKSDKAVPRGFWKAAANRKQFFDWFAKHLNLRRMEDWYSVTKSQIDEEGAAQSIIRRYYQGNLIHALKEAYPEHQWELTRFVNKRLVEVPKETEEQRAVFDRLGKNLGIQDLNGWYSYTKGDIIHDREAKYLLAKHGDSLRSAIKAAYPDHSWLDWRFAEVARNFWNQPENQKMYLEWLGKNQLGIQTLNDWYNIQLPAESTPPELRSLLVMYHNNSLASALMSVYPQHDWEPWRFPVLPRWFWKDSEDALPFQARYISYLEKLLHISSMDSWYRVSREDIRALGGKEFPDRLGVLGVLRRVYPDHPWDPKFFSQKGKKSSQRRLRRTLEALFPESKIHEEFRLLATSGSPGSKASESIELDYYIPDLSLAFEFHGSQHYGDVHTVEQSDKRSQTDLRKAEVCKAAGVTFIEIPYWLDLSTDKVAKLIHKLRPDLHLKL